MVWKIMIANAIFFLGGLEPSYKPKKMKENREG